MPGLQLFTAAAFKVFLPPDLSRWPLRLSGSFFDCQGCAMPAEQVEHSRARILGMHFMPIRPDYLGTSKRSTD
jgi:hypothetical protein